MSKETETETEKEVSSQLRLPADLMGRANDAAKQTGLSRNDVMRHALRIGLPLVEKALSLTGEQLASIPADAADEPLPLAG